jgi:hypothetical protein
MRKGKVRKAVLEKPPVFKENTGDSINLALEFLDACCFLQFREEGVVFGEEMYPNMEFKDDNQIGL